MISRIPREGTEFELPCDIVVSAIGQMGDLAGLEELDNGKGFIETDNHFSVSEKEAHFAGGDIIRPHLLTTAIGQGRVAADSINSYLAGSQADKRPKVDVFHFNLLTELVQRDMEPDNFDHTPTRGTSEQNFAVHNYEDRSATLLAIALSGLAMKYIAHTDVVMVKAFMLGLMYFDIQPLPEDPAVLIHLGLVALLMIVFPFSKLSSSFDISFPITPGNNLNILSIYHQINYLFTKFN